MSDKPSFIQRFIKDRDRNAILICVVIAISFWMTDALSHTYTHDYSFTIVYELQDNVSFASAPRENIQARLSGQGWELLKASIRRRFKRVPVTVLRPEITRSDLIAAVYQHLSEYDLVVREVDIDVMTLDINMVIARSIPVVLDITAECAPGFVFKDSLKIEPARVSATGPSSLVERLAPIKLEPIELSPLTSDLDQVVNVLLPEGPYINFEPKQIHLLAKVEKLVQMTTVLPVQLEGDTSGVVCTPESVSLSYYLGESLTSKDELNHISAVVTISAEDLTSGNALIVLNNLPTFIQDVVLGNTHVRIDSILIETDID